MYMFDSWLRRHNVVQLTVFIPVYLPSHLVWTLNECIIEHGIMMIEAFKNIHREFHMAHGLIGQV